MHLPCLVHGRTNPQTHKHTSTNRAFPQQLRHTQACKHTETCTVSTQFSRGRREKWASSVKTNIVSLSSEMCKEGTKPHLPTSSKNIFKDTEGNIHPEGSARKSLLHITQFSNEKIIMRKEGIVLKRAHTQKDMWTRLNLLPRNQTSKDKN